MFGKRKSKHKRVVVTTKEELKTAINKKEPYIEVQGNLVNKMKWMGKISKKKIAALTALLLAAASNPVTATTAVGVTAVEGAVGVGSAAAVIGLISVLGIVTIVAIFKDYEIEVEVEGHSLRLTKK